MKTEQYFKNTMMIAFFEALVRLKGLIIIPLLANHFQSYEYGVWSQLLVFLLFVQPLMSWMIEDGFVRKSSGYDSVDRQKYFSSALMLSLTSGLVILGILSLFSTSISNALLKTEGHYELFFILGLMDVLLMSVNNLCRQWFLVDHKIFIFSISNFILAALNIISAVVVVTFDQSVFELILYKVMSDGFVFLFLLGAYLMRHKIVAPSRDKIKTMLKYSLQVVPMVLITTSIDGIDRFFINYYSGLSDVGVYSLAYGLGAMIILTFSAPLWSTYTSIMTGFYNQNDSAGMQKHFDNAAGTLFLLLCPATAGVFLTSGFIIDFFASDQFLSASMAIGWICLGYTAYLMSSYFKVSVDLVIGPYTQLFVYGVALVANIIGNIWLVPFYGIEGAGISTFIAFGVALILNMLIAYFKARLVKVSWSFVIKILCATTVMYYIGIGLQSYGVPDDFIGTMMIVVCCAIVYGFLMFSLNVVTWAQVSSMYQTLRKRKT